MILRFGTVGRHTHAVPTADAFAALKAQVVQAALAGAALVDVPLLGERNVSVLITPNQTVAFEE